MLSVISFERHEYYFACCYFQNEVNAIKWDPQGQLLASCSDDMSLKVPTKLLQSRGLKSHVELTVAFSRQQEIFLILSDSSFLLRRHESKGTYNILLSRGLTLPMLRLLSSEEHRHKD